MPWYQIGPDVITPNDGQLRLTVPPTLVTSLFTNATGDKVAILGQICWPDGGSHDITTVGFRTGSITSAGGSSMDMSLQDVLTSAGPPYRPDETKDQSVTFNINTLSSNTWSTLNLSTNRTIAHGAMVAVVFEWTTVRVGSDIFIMSCTSLNSGIGNYGAVTKTTLTWTIVNGMPNVVFTATDGVKGSFFQTFPYAAIGNVAYHVTNSPDEYALSMLYPMSVRLSGVRMMLTTTNTSSNFEVCIYDHNSVAVMVMPIDANTLSTAADKWFTVMFPAPIELWANTLYRMSVRPTTTNSVKIRYLDVNANADLDFWLGRNFYLWQRADLGTWTGVATRIPMFIPVLSHFFAS